MLNAPDCAIEMIMSAIAKTITLIKNLIEKAEFAIVYLLTSEEFLYISPSIDNSSICFSVDEYVFRKL